MCEVTTLWRFIDMLIIIIIIIIVYALYTSDIIQDGSMGSSSI